MNKYFLNGLYSVLGFIVISAFAFKIFQPIKVLPRMQLSPAFSLVDQDSARLTSEDLRGQFVLYTFAYTNCPEACTAINDTMKEVQSRLSEVELDGISVSFVTISMDPQRDTPEALNAYAQSINANTEQWKFATTTNETLLKTIIGSGFETYYEKKEDGSFALLSLWVDGWGIVRAEYRYTTEVSMQIASFATRCASEEVRNSKGTTAGLRSCAFISLLRSIDHIKHENKDFAWHICHHFRISYRNLFFPPSYLSWNGHSISGDFLRFHLERWKRRRFIERFSRQAGVDLFWVYLLPGYLPCYAWKCKSGFEANRLQGRRYPAHHGFTGSPA
jgi:protein SCO1/2